MHIHGIQRNTEALNLYAATAAAQAAATRRADEVRKKLVRNASTIAGGLDVASFAISQKQQNNSDPEQEERTRAATKNKELREESDPDGPVSTWA